MTKQPRERPLLAKPSLLRGLRDGSKTTLRLPLTQQPVGDDTGRWTYIMSSTDSTNVGNAQYSIIDPEGWSFTERGREKVLFSAKCPLGQPGERLWLRETCRAEENENGVGVVRYMLDQWCRPIDDTRKAAHEWLSLFYYRQQRGRLVPAVHMPRWASRYLLEIVSIQVRRLRDITWEEAVAEGCPGYRPAQQEPADQYRLRCIEEMGQAVWDANPWCWVVAFENITANKQ